MIGTIAILAILGLLFRLVQVRRVRFQRVNEIQRRYAHLVDKLDDMSYKDAEEILKVSQHYDHPFMTVLSLSFALFKTYAIPSISSVLCKSNELGSAKNAGRRAEDTTVVIGEFVNGGGLDSERGTAALARMNFLHGRYGNLITREDKLYTLSLFIFEPALFIEKYEWRPLTPLEAQARYVFWREIGARMGIADIPATRQALWDWKEAYAVKAVQYAEGNTQVGDATLDVFVRAMPGFTHGFGKQASMVFLDEQTRKAFGFPRSPQWMYTVVPALVRVKGLVGRYLLLPRTKPPIYNDVVAVKDDKGETRYQRKGFLWEPWYVSEDASPLGLFAFLRPGKQWHSEGFKPSTLGPERLMNQGEQKVLKEAEEMRTKAMGCPFF